MPSIQNLQRRLLLKTFAATSVLGASGLALAQAGSAKSPRVLRIGYQKGWLSILKSRGTLEKRLAALGASVSWTEFTAGPVQLEALYDALAQRIAQAEAAGIARNRIAIDPGIGFGKTLEQNLVLLARLSLFHALGVPVLLGASRKRFIGTLSGVEEAQRRMPGSLAVALAGIAQGMQMVRVHDVAETRQALSLWQAVTGGKPA